MTYNRYGGANLAQDTITPWITAAATTITVDSKGALFPAHDGATNYNYPCLIEQFDASGVCTKREMVLVTARTWNQFNVTRSFGSVPWSDTATSQGTTAYAFDEWARFSLMTAWELIKEILDWLDERVTKTEFQQASQIYAASSTGNDSYAVTLDPVPASLSAIKWIMFKADVANTWAATLNINSLGAKAIKKNWWADDLEDGDIAADQIVLCVYDATNDVYQMSSILWVAPSGGAISWSAVTGTTKAMVAGEWYWADNASQVVFTLPSTAAIGTVLAVVWKWAGWRKIAQNASQSIKYNGKTSAVWTWWYIESTWENDCIELVCVDANTQWIVRSVVWTVYVRDWSVTSGDYLVEYTFDWDANDTSWNANHGTATGASYTTVWEQEVLVLNWTTTYITTPAGLIDSEWFISIAFKATWTSTDYCIIGNTQTSVSDYLQTILPRSSTAKINGRVKDEFLQATVTKDTEWHLLVLAYDNAGTWELLLDNVSLITWWSSKDPSNAFKLFLWALSNWNSLNASPQYFAGNFALFRLSDTAYTASKWLNLYNEMRDKLNLS